jgi:acetoin utilization deacetylase AcuC-like enzyme
MTNQGRCQLVWSDRYRDHATVNHPETPERIDALKRALTEAGITARFPMLVPEPAALDSVAAVHTESLISRVRQAAERGGHWLDPDTFVSPASYEIALLAAGGAITAVDAVMASGQPAFSLSRPPGHHAEPWRAMGFCLFNSVAVAARWLQRRHGLERVAIIDWDVHHGNGTQAIFWEDPSVFFASLHQHPLYPGTGLADEQGSGAGQGFTLNIPLPPGTDDAAYQAAFSGTVIPRVRAFQPDFILVSAGFDAHAADPLANLQLTSQGFAALARMVQELAADVAQDRFALVLEGGYNLNALGESAVAVIEAIG